MAHSTHTWRKILIVLQFCKHDQRTAVELARLIADLQSGHSERADILLASRYDTRADEAMINGLARKFNVYTHVCRRQAQGWPYGPNELWFDTMAYIYEMRSAGKFPDYKAILFIEPDTCPMRVDWIDALRKEWDAAGTNIVGTICPLPRDHVNGNAMFSGDMKFLEWSSNLIGCSPHAGWDVLLAPKLKEQGWFDTPLIFNLYKAPSIDPALMDFFFEVELAFLHGVKDLSAIRYARQKLLIKK